MASLLGNFGALVEQLAPIGDKRRGMRIEADEWNALVGVVKGMLELEFQQEASLETEFRESFAPRAHDHVGEVALGWLDAELQERLAGDGGSGVGTRFTLSEMQSRLNSLGTEVARLTTLAESLQTQLNRAQVDDLDRSSKLRGFENRFGAVEDLRGLVNGLSAQVGGLEPRIDAVLELRDRLGDVDVRELQTRFAEVERSLRSSLTGVDGRPLRLRDLALRIDELDDVVRTGTPGGLDDRFAALEGTLDTRIDTRLDSGLQETRTATAADVADARGALETQFTTRLDATRAALTAAADERADADRKQLEASFASRVDGVAADLRGTLGAATTAQIDGRLAGLSTQVSEAARGAVAAATPALREQIGAAVRADLATNLTAAEASFRARADALDARFAERDTALSAQISDRTRQELPPLVEAGVAKASEKLGAQLGARVDQQLAQAGASLDTRLREQVSGEVTSQISDQLERSQALTLKRAEALVREGMSPFETRLTKIERRIPPGGDPIRPIG